MTVTLHVEFFGNPGRGDEIEALLAEMAFAVHGTEPSCLRYDVGRSVASQDDFLVWEEYADEAAFESHRVTPHFERLIVQQLPPLIRDRRRTDYRMVASGPA